MKPVPTKDDNMTYKGPTPDIGDLPCHRVRPGFILSEWDLTKAERIAIARGGRIELGIHSEPIPPVQLSVVQRDEAGDVSYVDEHGPWEALTPDDIWWNPNAVQTPTETKVRKWGRRYLYGRSRANDWPLWTSWLLAPSRDARRRVRTLMEIKKAA